MILPGGDALLLRACELICEQFEQIEARHNPEHRPRRFAHMSPAAQQIYMRAMRPILEMTVETLLTNMASAVSEYDGCQGAAYERAVHRFAITELQTKLYD